MATSVERLAAAHDVLAPAGPQAAQVKDLWDLMLWVCTAVFVVVLLACAWALWRSRRPDERLVNATPADVGDERGPRRSVATAVVASTLLLLFLIGASIFTDRALAQLSLKDALHIEVTASQWWWEARYDDPEASRMFTVANEVHVPVGRPVILTLRSSDVIHSFWAPNLGGKKDLIPGRTATLSFRADQPGVYRGQCAEFCGYQHAYMSFRVVADPPSDYARWADGQRASAAEPADDAQRRGREVFLRSTCAMCHAIQGTRANARRAPDLTHVASRQTIAAGTLANTPEDMSRWIRSPQEIKPGTNMPSSDLAEEDLQAVVAYLGSLR
jgi:cytochrome c oxidase subunit 2